MKSVVVKSIIASSVSLMMISCGGTGQDDGTESTLDTTFGGIVIDGYLARATVFLDTNNDGTRNAWEPFAFTDDQGYFSYNPITDTNYCAATASASEAQYCLRTNTNYANVVLRVDSGYDVLTGEPFVGQMSRRLNNLNGSNVENSVVTPITSLLTNTENDSDQQTILNSLGLEPEDLDVDYLNTDGSGEVEPEILNAALKVHKVVSVLGDRITDVYDEIGEEVGTPNDATAAVYSNLASQLISSGLDFDNAVADTTTIATVLDSAEESMRAVYERKEFTLPQDMGSASNPEGFSRVIDVASEIVDVVNSVIDPMDTSVDAGDVMGRARAVESVVIKALDETSNDQTIENASAFFANENNDELIDALIEGLSSETGDLVALADNDFSGDDFDSVEEIAEVTQLPIDAVPFTQIGGMQLRVSDLDLGRGPDKLDDSEVELYFAGEATDVSGSFVACVKHIDDANVDGSLGEGSTRGEIVDGFWSLLGADEQDMSSYSLLITLTFLETTYQAIMKPSGLETVGDNEYEKIRFDNDGEINVWHSAQGLVQKGTVPSTNEDCETLLPSRIGL